MAHLLNVLGTGPRRGCLSSGYLYRSHKSPTSRGIIRAIFQHYLHGTRFDTGTQRGRAVGIRGTNPVMEFRYFLLTLGDGMRSRTYWQLNLSSGMINQRHI